MPSTPNILMVIVHDLGQYLGCYGYSIKTPNLDQLAAAGVRFDNYHCTAAQCSPSRGSIMTGLYPHNNGLVGLAHIGWEYNSGVRKLPEYLREQGYASFLFGAQHESADPGSLGYDRVFRSGGQARQAAAAFCAQAPELAASHQPFFACVGFNEPHRPYGQEGYRNDPPERVTPLPWLPDRPGIREDIGGLNGLVYEVDDRVGQIVARLEETGLRENTLVIFTTDHGTAMPRAKGTCFDPGTKTALIWSLPGRFDGGKAHGELLSNVDLLPSLVELAGGKAPAGIDGRSFLPLADGRPYTPRDHVFLEMTWHDRYNPMRAIRTTTHKYIRSFGDRPLVYLPADIYVGRAGEEVRHEYYSRRRPEEELYDLQADPLEQRDVAGVPEMQPILAELRGRVQAWMEATNDPILEGDWPPTEAQYEREQEDATPNG